MYAIFVDRGRQHLVEKGQTLYIDRHEAEEGASIEFERVLMTGGGDVTPTIGKPALDGAKVVAKVVSHTKGPKIHVQTYKRRKNFKRHIGHRAQMTEIEIVSIEG